VGAREDVGRFGSRGPSYISEREPRSPWAFPHLWEWDGSVWTEIPDPPPGWNVYTGDAAAYDAARGQLVGQHPGGNYLWNDPGWTMTGLSATIGDCPTLEYDAAREVVVMVCGSSIVASNVGEWDGTDWALVHPAGDIPPAEGNLYFDASRQRTMMFAARDHGLQAWEWDGVTWTYRPPTAL
jgi:hypothetical protein